MHALTLTHPTSSRSLRAWRVAAWVSTFLAFAILIALSSPAHAGALSFTQGTQVNDVDTDPATTDTITIPFSAREGNESIADVNITITIGNTANGDGGPYTGDLQLTLEHPGGASIELKPDGGSVLGSGNITWTFDDQAATAVNADSVSGTFSPTDALSTFDGLTPDGVWTLSILDTSFPDEGDYLVSWTLNIQALPEPGSAALFGAAACGLFAVARRRRRRRRRA